jgi:hypothetical protein
MAISRERFDSGMTVEAYKAQMKTNQEQFEENERKATLRPEDVTFFAALPQPLNALVITEDWCGDALANVPVLAKLARETGKLNVRIFLRDQNLDLADQYLKEGKYRSVPVFAFFDQDMRELGHFIERPARATQEMTDDRARLVAAHPEVTDINGPYEAMSESTRKLVFGSLRQLRERRSQAWTEMLLDDIKGLLSGVSSAR